MVLIYESLSSKHSYLKQALWIYFIHSNPFFIAFFHISLVRPLPLLAFSKQFRISLRTGASGDIVGYDQTIANDIGSASLELILP
jgi:hypothetical protein